MPYSPQLQFVIEMLKNMNIPSHIVKNPEFGISDEIDCGLRSMIYDSADYSDFLVNSMSEARSNTIYRFFDEYNCNYIFMRLPHDDEDKYFFIGPFLFHIIQEEVLWKKFRALSPTSELLDHIKQYYASLPIIEDENLLLTIANTLAWSLWGSYDNFRTEYINYVIPDRREPIPINSSPALNSEQKFPLHVLERNYANEKLLMDAVSQGKLNRLNVIASTVFNNGTEQRLNDSLRNRKNYLIILKTLLRKAAEQGGVHPYHLHKTSSHYADKIESIHSIKESLLLQEEMIRNYCLLVINNSLSKYSYIVGKAITIISYDLLADLSLKSISEQLNVSPAYFSGLFKKECGCTLTEYVKNKRLDIAIDLLANSEKQVQTIAYECGFQDPNYFIRQFKRYTGMTPGQYRKTL